MIYPDRWRLPLQIDPQRLQKDLEGLSAMTWTRHFVAQNYDGDWDVLALRSVAGARHPVTMIYADPTATAFEDTPLLSACPYFRDVLAMFACDLQSVRLMRLSPGSVIKLHRDHDLGAEGGKVRFHVPITTNPQVAFELNGQRLAMQAGDAWCLRLCDPHRAANHGSASRVHMVIDGVDNAWLQSLFRRSQPAAVAAPPP